MYHSLIKARIGMSLLFATLFLAACANQDMTRSGFLSNYAELRQLDSDKTEAVTINSQADFSQYTHVMIMPVVYAGKTPDDDKKWDYQDLARTVEKNLQEKFARRFTLTNQPAPNVLMVRAAITDITKAKPVVNVLTTAVVGPLFNGGLSGEAEIVDSMTGTQLAALTYADEGSVWRFNQMSGSFSQMGHAEYLSGIFATRVFELTQKSRERVK
jgi:hypothetical protein